ncbi:MAG: symmetrical bis(5'-nucleosyl)-tetraphosphatase [bacterium]|nr:symmetrical bis(5'-nucleosyl)-tetraphosphatase [bacterium]
MAVHAIGDVQGCCDELEELLEKIAFDPSRDRVWITGDLVNRGPRSLDVLRLVRGLGDAAVTVLGNHDLHLLAAAFVPGTRTGKKDTFQDVLAAPDRDELLGWLRRRPLLHHDADLGLTMVHAGLAPQWDLATARACAAEIEAAVQDDARIVSFFRAMYGDQPDRWSDELTGWDRMRVAVNALTRIRFCTPDGRLDLAYDGGLAEAPAGLVPWFRMPGRRWQGARVVCGHWAALGYHVENGVTAIDAGCVWGQRLCAVRLDAEGEPVFARCGGRGR